MLRKLITLTERARSGDFSNHAARSRMPTRRARLLLSLGCALALAAADAEAQKSPSSAPSTWTVPDVDALPDDANGRLVRGGRDLVTATYAHVGPEVPDPAKRYAGNNLACTNCHLEAGTKMFAIPLFGLFGEFPQYSARSGGEITIEDRINACMTRSMNGRSLPTEGSEMQAFIAYIRFLSTGVAPGQRLPGMGVGRMPVLDRPADPVKGRDVYMKACVDCHNENGAGVRRGLPSMDFGYAMPPLWGPDSFNSGAGMARLIAIANFVHFNMPHGADYLNPQLTAEQAWDVAAYVVSKPRPAKPGLDKDFPDLLQKPVDAPYGPYADSFSELQHKYGPFGPIRAAIAALKAGQIPARSGR